MKAFLLFVLFIFTPITFSQNLPHLFELRGLEDSLGNTHLFYRYGGMNTSCWQKDIYHLDLINNIDTLFIPDFGYIAYPGSSCEGIYVFDYEFFNDDPAKFIYGGYDLWIDPIAIIVRYDGEIQIPSFGGITDIEISQQNDSLVYAALGGGLYKSIDGGYNFTINLDSLALIDDAMISLSRNDDSQIYGIDQNKLARSEDEGQSYIIVDDDIHWGWNYGKELYYDADGQHIYGVSTSSNESALLVSDSNGDPFTWNLILTTHGKIWFTLDEQYQGEIYYSYKKNIYKSTDFGNTFSLYKELDQKVTGLYKKSSTNILYASTIFRIYEITPDTMQIIKSLPIPDDILNFYPLAVGNKWIYDKYTISEGNSYYDIFIREVISDSLLPNGKQYYLVKEHNILSLYSVNSFERIDSATGLIYRYYEDPGLPDSEYLIDDLLSEVGDTIWSSREFYDSYFPTIVIEQNTFNKWGLEKPRIIYKHLGLGFYTHSLTQDIGLDSIGFHFDFGNTDVILKGCIIDGVVYGDTTVVSVEDVTSNLPTEFSLSQNYPNPFNPSTKISWQSPVGGWQILKVYDILGNEVATLVNEELPAGEYEVEFSVGQNSILSLSSGVYFYQLRIGDPSTSSGQGFIETKKMLLLK